MLQDMLQWPKFSQAYSVSVARANYNLGRLVYQRYRTHCMLEAGVFPKVGPRAANVYQMTVIQ